MKIIQNTNITPITTDKLVKPLHPMWMIDSRGFGYTQPFFINGNYLIAYNDRFGVDATNMLLPVMEAIISRSPHEKILIKNDTQFDIKFIPSATLPKIIHLIETSFEFVREPHDKIKAMKPGQIAKTTTITISTSFTPYNKSTKITPKGCLWFIKNNGVRNVMLQQNYLLNNGATFGVDTTNILAKAIEKNLFEGERIQVESDTQFDMVFVDGNIISQTNVPDQQVLLIETHFKVTRK